MKKARKQIGSKVMLALFIGIIIGIIIGGIFSIWRYDMELQEYNNNNYCMSYEKLDNISAYIIYCSINNISYHDAYEWWNTPINLSKTYHATEIEKDYVIDMTA